jgi:antiviral helicase SLH1
MLGVVADEDDLHLNRKRRDLVIAAARKLANARMISFDEARDTFTITDLGRIAARYYIRHASIEVYNERFTPRMTEADILSLLSYSTEVISHFCN